MELIFCEVVYILGSLLLHTFEDADELFSSDLAGSSSLRVDIILADSVAQLLSEDAGALDLFLNVEAGSLGGAILGGGFGLSALRHCGWLDW